MTYRIRKLVRTCMQHLSSLPHHTLWLGGISYLVTYKTRLANTINRIQTNACQGFPLSAIGNSCRAK